MNRQSASNGCQPLCSFQVCSHCRGALATCQLKTTRILSQLDGSAARFRQAPRSLARCTLPRRLLIRVTPLCEGTAW